MERNREGAGRVGGVTVLSQCYSSKPSDLECTGMYKVAQTRRRLILFGVVDHERLQRGCSCVY